jgi:hypothetical protein
MKKQILKNRFSELKNLLILAIVIPVTLLHSCKSNNDNKIIPVKDLIDILTEAYIADGILPFPAIQKRFASKDSIAN